MGNTVASILRNLLPAEDIIVNRICRLGGRRISKFSSSAVEDSNTVERGDGMGVLSVTGKGGDGGREEGGGGKKEVGAATGRFTVSPVLDSVLSAGPCNKLSTTARVTSLKINNETQTLSVVVGESFWQKHRARIAFAMTCTCFTAATLALVQLLIKSIIAII